MSLINDALKRASQSDKGQLRESSTRAPMQAVETTSRGSKLPIILLVFAALLLMAAGFYIWRGGKEKPVTVASSKPVEVKKAASPAPVSAPAVESTPPQKVVPVQTPAPAPQAPVAPVAVQQAPPTQTNAPAVSEAIPFPDLRVKAIIYRSKDPLAIINGRTVGIGNTIEGARIIKIQRQAVVFEFYGQVRDVPMD